MTTTTLHRWPRATLAWAILGAVLLANRADAATLGEIRQRGALRWGADAEGGAPYVFHDPAAPDRLIGFELELAEALAQRLGVKAQMFQANWDMLIPAVKQGAFDVILNGLELTAANQQLVEMSRPYFCYQQQIVTRPGAGRFAGLADLRGATVGALSSSVSFRLLTSLPEVHAKVYAGNAEAFRDLKIGRLDAVVVDSPIAQHFAVADPELRLSGAPFAPGYYGIGVPLGQPELLRALNDALAALLADGALERIYRRYGLWGPEQLTLRDYRAEAVRRAAPPSALRQARRYLPLLLRASVTTIWLTGAGMIVAIVVGLAVALLRLYGPGPARWLAVAYIELVRGTPLLIQLYFIYYGLAQQLGLRMSEYAAAVLALGLNYAANEAENYRAGINAVPRGQWEAASALGMSRRLTLRRIILPQALRLVLPPMSNDFIAMFKDSSIVSVIAIVELTKEYQIRASDTGDYLGLGVLTAGLYFGMSYAASLLMQRLERRRHDHR